MKLSHFLSRNLRACRKSLMAQRKWLLTLKAPSQLSFSRSYAPAHGGGEEYSADTSREHSAVDTIQLPSVKGRVTYRIGRSPQSLQTYSLCVCSGAFYSAHVLQSLYREETGVKDLYIAQAKEKTDDNN